MTKQHLPVLYQQLALFVKAKKQNEKRDFSKELEILQEALTKYSHCYGKHSIPVAYCHELLSQNYAKFGNLEKQLKHSQKALDTALLHTECLPLNINAYNNMGIYFAGIQNYDKAISYFHKSLEIAHQSSDWQQLIAEEVTVFSMYSNIGFCYQYKGEYDTAIQYFEQAKNIITDLYDSETPAISQPYIGIANCYGRKKNHEKALLFSHKAEQILQKNNSESLPKAAILYSNIANLYAETSVYDKAHQYYQKSLPLHLRLFGEKHPQTAYLYANIGYCLRKQKQFEVGLQHFQKALNCLYPQKLNFGNYELPPLSNCSDKNTLLYVIQCKASTLAESYKYHSQLESLEAAYKYYQLAFKIIHQIRNSYLSENSKLTIAQNISLTIDAALQTATLLHQKTNKKDYLTAILSYLEEGKALVLQSAIKDADAKLKGKIPPHLLQKERSLRKKLIQLDKKIIQTQIKGISFNTKHLLQLQAQHFDLNQQFEALVKQFETEFPNYFKWKYQQSSIQLQDIQNQLEEGEVLLEYFEGKYFLFILCIHRQKIHVRQIEKTLDFAKNIDQLNEAIALCDEEWLKKIARKLSTLLIEPVLKEEKTKNVHKLIIIPDGNLFRLPFDILQIPSKSEVSYLIEQYEISYHYSTTLWLSSNLNPTQNDSFLGIAPVHFNDPPTTTSNQLVSKSIKQPSITTESPKLNDLWDSEKEVKQVEKLFASQNLAHTSLLHQEAHQENLEKHIKGKKYILLSTHGFIHPVNSSLSGIYLASKNNASSIKSKSENYSKLYTSDTYLLQLDADLVVLSSCESGIGKLQKGEGMMALNRAFLFAGATNIIYSLFKIPDATSQFTTSFFHFILKEKDSYSKALQKAKHQMIKEGKEPLFWAGMALIGR